MDIPQVPIEGVPTLAAVAGTTEAIMLSEKSRHKRPPVIYFCS